MKGHSIYSFHRLNIILSQIISLRVKNKRQIYLWMRTAGLNITEHTFFPSYGFTAGEFAIGQLLNLEVNRKKLRVKHKREQ
jgi:hypothetical protein